MKKCGYNTTSSAAPDAVQQSEGPSQSRKLYRSIADIQRQLDNARSAAQSISDLFSPMLLVQRSRLRDKCEQMIFADPLLYGRKGEELLWRKGYYEVVSTAKRLKKNEYTADEIAHLQSHINSGIGHYHHHISRLQSEFGLDLQGSIDFPLWPSTYTKKHKSEITEWAELSVHRTLIYLGDLSRYRLEIFPNWNPDLAIRYYQQAYNFKPEYGMPHNQMGNLSSGLNYSLDSVYHYMRCLSCPHIFEGSERNLRDLFEKNSLALEQLPQPQEAPSEATDHIKSFIIRFLFLADVWYFEKKIPKLPELCDQVLIDLQNCLTYSKPVASVSEDSPVDLESLETDSTVPQHLSTDVVFKIVAVCILCITQLQKHPQQISTVKAFTLAVFSQLIQTVVNHIHENVMLSPEPQNHTNGFVSKMKLSKLRRRKHENSSDSDLSDTEIALNESSGSSSENTDVSSDESEEEAPKVTAPEEKKAENAEVGIVKKARRIDTGDLLDIVTEEGLLQSVRVLCDWLLSDADVLKDCQRSRHVLLTRIVSLLNVINIDMRPKKVQALKIKDDILKADHRKLPLPEDVTLRDLPLLRPVQENIDWKFLTTRSVSAREETFVRISKLVGFGNLLAEAADVGISYDKKKKLFVVEEVLNELEQNNEGPVASEDQKPENGIVGRWSRGRLMGQLWLAAEIKDLESRVHGKTAFSPYLVVDADALTSYTHLVKQLVFAKKFIILVPTVVVQVLDELKKETIKARDAIRWLETQLHRGNRFLRAQRPHERSPLPLIKYPKKKEKDSFTFIQIMECCHFLTQQQKDSTNLVTLLTGNQALISSAENRDFSYVGLAQSIGVAVELISAFHAKWKKISKGVR